MSTPLASEGSTHWYLGADCERGKIGDPCYTVIGKNGNERPVTLADVRKHPEWAAVPSVTLILRCAAAPGLEAWKARQILESALTLPKLDGETLDDYAKRVIEDSKEQGRKAAETGTALHAAIEQFIGRHPYDPKWTVHITQVRATLLQYGIDLFSGRPEHSFASPLDYGGKLDWHSDEMILDFKSKDTVADKKQLAFDEHCWQLAAYAGGVGNMSARTRLLNVFVGVRDCEVRVHEWNEDDISRGWYAFLALLEFWKLKNNWKSTNK